jgi:type IV fimbrial biogenesis protein FimT
VRTFVLLLPANALARPPHPPTDRANGRAHGFTMIEMLAVVAIVGILAALAAPGLAQLIATVRAGGAASDLYQALATARSEATKRNTNVTLARKSGAWINGWTIVDPGDASKILLDRNALEGAAITASLASVVYQSSGRVQGSVRPTFAIATTSGSTTISKNVCVDISGRPYVSDSACP